MKPQEQRRKVIADLYAAGNNAANIVKVTKYPKRTVYDVVKRLKDGRGIEHKPCGPHKAKKRTKTFLAGLKRSIKANPAVSIRAHAARRGVSRKTMSKAIKEDLGLKSYVRGRRHLLTEKMKAVRLERSQKLRRICKVNPGVVRLFSDESIFTVDGAYNPQNDRWLSEQRSGIPHVMKTKNPAKIMVFGLITSDGKVMPAHIFPPGTTVNSTVYLELLDEVVLPWLRTAYPPETNFMWIQDSAPCHTAKKVLEYLTSKFSVVVKPDEWPSNSPDLNPCDY